VSTSGAWGSETVPVMYVLQRGGEKSFDFLPERAVHISTSYFINFHVTTFRKYCVSYQHTYFFGLYSFLKKNK